MLNFLKVHIRTMNNEFLSDSVDGFEDEDPDNRMLWRLPKRYIRDWEFRFVNSNTVVNK